MRALPLRKGDGSLFCRRYPPCLLDGKDSRPLFRLVRGGDHTLFDRLNDPHQMNNLYGDPRYTKVVKDLHDRILAHNIAVKAPAAAWLKTV